MKKLSEKSLVYLIADTQLCHADKLIEIVALAVREGVNVVQLRGKDCTTRSLLEIGFRLKKVLDQYDIPLIINDRVDIAIALEADGVHLGQTDMPCAIARKILGSKKIIGLTINSLAQVQMAECLDVDYLGIGAIFPTQTKTDVGDLWNLVDLKKARQLSRHILVAIGGINASNAREILKLGFNGIAVASAILMARDPQANTVELVNIVQNYSIKDNKR